MSSSFLHLQANDNLWQTSAFVVSNRLQSLPCTLSELWPYKQRLHGGIVEFSFLNACACIDTQREKSSRTYWRTTNISREIFKLQVTFQYLSYFTFQKSNSLRYTKNSLNYYGSMSWWYKYYQIVPLLAVLIKSWTTQKVSKIDTEYDNYLQYWSI